MQHINRLLQAARKVIKGEKGRYIMGFVNYDPANGRYIATALLWDGVPGAGQQELTSKHDTSEEAAAACEAVAAVYPRNESLIVYIDDGFE